MTVIDLVLSFMVDHDQDGVVSKKMDRHFLGVREGDDYNSNKARHTAGAQGSRLFFDVLPQNGQP